MTDLRTNYMGLELKNPLIVGASNLVVDIKNLKKLEEAGAAAIVYKSLFEEQIQLESLQQEEAMGEYAERNAEMLSLFPDLEHAGPEEFLMNFEEARKSISIPMIASLNAVYQTTWNEYAVKLEEAGAAGLELNFYAVPKDASASETDIINEQVEIVRDVVKQVNIPVSVKLSPFYTNILQVVDRMEKAGAKGFVLFNRLFQPDIDLENEEHYYPYNLSNPEDNRLALRFAGLLYGNINGSVCSNTGIFEGTDMLKMIIAGATCVQIVSTLYKNKFDQIPQMLSAVEEWMAQKGYNNLNDFRGKLSKKNVKNPYTYKRAQYIDILMKSEQIFNKYPMR